MATKQVTISQEELDELRKFKEQVEDRKTKSKARSKARSALIKAHQAEFDRLVAQYSNE